MQKHEFLGLRISHETKKALAKKADEEKRTLSNYVRLVLEKEAKNKEEKK
jgi:predicted HicB family RNase H-like nuclease